MQTIKLENFVPFADGLDHPEGVAWGPDGYVYAGGEAGQVYRVDLDSGQVEEIASTGGFLLGLCLDADANIYACDLGKGEIARITQRGEVSVYSNGSPERKMVTPNYATFDKAGNLYVSDSGEWDQANGCIFRIKPGGETEVVNDEPLPFPNGLALSPDGTELYIVLSNLPGVGKVQIRPDGQVGPMEQVVEMPQAIPDGLAFDELGNLYISCYTPDRIYCLTPGGELVLVVDDWRSVTLSSPTNIAFCGTDLSTLVVASLARWHLTKGQMPISGSPVCYPNL